MGDAKRHITLEALKAELALERLAVFGAFHPEPDDGAPKGAQTLLLLGPAEPGYWAHLTASPEWRDGRPDPVDRWSRRVIGRLACSLGAKAVFPFGGPPFAPFTQWARRSGRAWQSPVSLLVGDEAGLMISYRGALALRERLDLPPPPNTSPCTTCAEKPCLNACPAKALTAQGYNVPSCRDYLSDVDRSCREGGCLVRRACPVSQSYGRVVEHSAYHMRHFLS